MYTSILVAGPGSDVFESDVSSGESSPSPSSTHISAMRRGLCVCACACACVCVCVCVCACLSVYLWKNPIFTTYLHTLYTSYNYRPTYIESLESCCVEVVLVCSTCPSVVY